MSSFHAEIMADALLQKAIDHVAFERALTLAPIDRDRLRGAWYLQTLTRVLDDPGDPDTQRVTEELVGRALVGWPANRDDRTG